MFSISGSVLPSVDLDDFKNRLVADILQVCDNKEAITERMLQKIKNQLTVSSYSSFKTNADIASSLAFNESQYGDYLYYKNALESFDKITLDEVRNVCKETFKKDAHIFLSLWDQHPEEEE